MRLEIGDILTQYEACLGKHGILQKYDKHFINHKLMDGPVLPPTIENAIDKIDMEDILLNPAELTTVTVSPVKTCNAGKEYNKKTKRCVKICKAGYSRDAAFKCKKNKTVKVKQVKVKPVKVVKPCPSSKERNPTTGRCIFICKPGYSRDADFKCKKTK